MNIYSELLLLVGLRKTERQIPEATIFEMKSGISIIIPTYNRENLIVQTIESVINQNFSGNIEIIISDDGSTDNTLTNIERFSDKIKVIMKPLDCPTQGVAGTRNRGIKSANGEYLCFLDSDDLFLPGHLSRMVDSLENNPGYGFAFCRTLELKIINGLPLYKPWTHKNILKNDVKNPAISRSHIVHTNSLIFRRSVFDTIGLFNETYSNGEDGDMWMRVSEKFKGKFVDHFGCVYRTNHSGDQLTRNERKKINNCSKLILEDARKRYYDLKLNDPKRIFKIKYNLLQLQKTKLNFNKRIHYIKYIGLVLKYPTGFFQLLYEEFYSRKERPEWYSLSKYLSEKSNNTKNL